MTGQRQASTARHLAKACTGGAFCLLLAACGEAFTTGAASMRIEVEVYKGPLSQDTHTQWGELLGMVREADDALGAIGVAYATNVIKAGKIDPCRPNEFVDAVASGNPAQLRLQIEERNNCARPKQALQRNILVAACWRDKSWLDHVGLRSQRDWSRRCRELIGILSDQVRLRDRYRNLAADMCHNAGKPFNQQHPIDCPPGRSTQRRSRDVVELLTEAAEISTRAHFKAFYRAGSSLGDERDPLLEMVETVNLYSNLANQIGSRADRLLLQIAGTDRKNLPLSVYLREVEPTDFMDLYEWYGTVSPEGEAEDKIRVMERLFADFNWANINTVYASGQGNVAMAFIKDDIGNWNLKSFENDPTELLKAYTEFTLEAIGKATDLVKAGITGGGTEALEQLGQLNDSLSLAGQASSGLIGGGDAAAQSLDVERLRQRAVGRLTGLRAQIATGWDSRSQAVQEAETEFRAALAVSIAAEAASQTADAQAGVPVASPASVQGEVNTKIEDARTRAFQAQAEVRVLGIAETADGRDVEQASQTAVARAGEAEAELTTALGGGATATERTAAGNARSRADAAVAWATQAEARLALIRATVRQTSAQQNLAAFRQQSILAVREILDDHGAVLDAVEDMVVAQRSQSRSILPDLTQ